MVNIDQLCSRAGAGRLESKTGLTNLFNALHAARRTHFEIWVSSRRRRLVVELGDPSSFGTTAYWLMQYAVHCPRLAAMSPRLGRTLKEETIACLLGGFGIPAEMALAAFGALRHRGLLADGNQPTVEALQDALAAIRYSDGKIGRYRFARQRASRVHAAVAAFSREERIPEDPTSLRKWLLRLPGIGPKTASWVVRNWTSSCDVAILDIHLIRAGRRAGWFPLRWGVERDYDALEEAFLTACRNLRTDADKLDAIIWEQMRMAGGAVRPTSRGRCRHPDRSGSIGTNPNAGGTHGRTGIV